MTEFFLHDIIAIQTNIPQLFSKMFLRHTKSFKSRLKIKVVDDSLMEEVNNFPKIEVSSNLYHIPSQNAVCSMFSFFRNKFGWWIQNLEKDTTVVKITKSAYRLIKMPISSVYPFWDFVKFIVNIKLLQAKKAMIIGGGVWIPEAGGIVISGGGGMGKTTTILKLMEYSKAKFLSEDTLIVSSSAMFSFPTKMRLRRVGTPVFSINKEVCPEQVLPASEIQKSSLINFFFFLEKFSRKEIVPISWKEGVQRVLAINRKIIPYFAERTILGYSYWNQKLDLNLLIRKEELILRKLFRQVKNVFVLRAPRTGDYPKLVMETIQK